MDYEKLRQQTLGSTQDEEAVTVNTRALIDKVLARYSGEHTTLRELIQNSADAQATTVKVKFETIPSPSVPLANTTNPSEVIKHVLLNHTIKRLVVSNDGEAFTSSDWNRLKKIAEGNPDVEKIGAFGVGFYSVFADCENPFVMSGNEAMAFYWKENALFTRRLKLSPEEASPNTSFVLDYRNQTSAVPALLPLCQFLATSLTFVALQGIELWIDDWKVLSLKKKTSPGASIPISRQVDTKTKDGLMTVKSLEKQGIQLDASVMEVVGFKPAAPAKPSSFGETYTNVTSEIPSLRSFFSRFSSSTSTAKPKPVEKEKAPEPPKEDLTAITTSNVFLRVMTASVATSVTKVFAAELERATKKPPPKVTRLSILTSSYNELAASKSDASFDVFASVHPTKKPGGRVFIGFPTFQTTGGGFHLSAPSLIPTVERESADLQARWVRNWNIELLRVAGIMTRLSYQSEMSDLGEEVKRAAASAGRPSKITKEDAAKFIPNALHILNSFSIKDSTPSSQVGQIIEEAFWTAFKQPNIEIYSTKGVLLTSQVRIETEDVSGFVEGLPVIQNELMSTSFVQKLKDFAILSQVTINDIKQELEAKALTKEQLISFLSWLGPKATTGSIPASTARSLMAVTVAMIGDENKGEVVTLSAVDSYSNPNKITAELPIPRTTLPHSLVKGINVTHLGSIGLEELRVEPWLNFIVEQVGQSDPEQDITKSARFSAQVLAVVSKNWDSMGPSSKKSAGSMLSSLPCIPTRYGLKRPAEAYFPSVKLFDDLPIVVNCPGVKEKFLSSIGVRKTVELEVIFNRLLHPPTAADGEQPTRKWSHVELIKYLASVREDIPADDMKRLKESRICPAEAGPPGKESTQGTELLFRFSELFEPKPALRELDLPIIQWPGPPGSYRVSSPEGKFLAYLGLRPYPSVIELVKLMASDNQSLRAKALDYYISNHQINGYPFGIDTPKPFLPLQGDEKRLVSPSECFTNESSALLGFKILRRDLHVHASKFGVAQNPPMAVCVRRLVDSPPTNRKSAVDMFNYFASRLGEIDVSQAQILSQSRIVPTAAKDANGTGEKPTSKVRYITPQQSFLGDSETYRDIFDYVDFGNQANAFLLRCGAKQQPSKLEIAALVCQEPARLLSVFQSPQKYLALLKSLAEESKALKANKTLWKQMKYSPFLLGMKEIPSQKSEKPESKQADDDDMEEDDAPIRQFILARPAEIMIVDDYSSFQHFRHSDLLFAPMDDTLEDFYASLGAPSLASCIEKKLSIGVLAESQRPGQKLARLVLERSKLFLHNYPRDAIKHDSRWLENNLSIETVKAISLKRTVRGRNLSHSTKQTAAINHELRKGWTLYITSQFDYYAVSEILANLLLHRAKHQEYMFMETMLTKSLYDLKDRGFNVDRILRAKAAQERIAEEERRKQLEAEQQKIKEQEQQWLASNQAPTATVARQSRQSADDQTFQMPGAFDSEERAPPDAPKKPKSRGIFADFQRRWGLDKSESDENAQQQNLLEGGPSQVGAPPSYDESQRPPHVNQQQTERRPGEVEKVTAPHELHRNLVSAVQASRAHDSSSLFSPPRNATVKEQASYCDSNSGQNITFLAEASNGMRIYISKEVPAQVANSFLGQNASSLNTFAAMLLDIGDVFNMSKKALHIYYDESGNTIAFNSKGSVFCNFRFYTQLHLKAVEQGPNGKVDAAIYWWTTLCHELAHNLVEDHSAAHSYYTESFVTQYFPRMAERASRYMTQGQEPRRAAASESLLD